MRDQQRGSNLTTKVSVIGSIEATLAASVVLVAWIHLVIASPVGVQQLHACCAAGHCSAVKYAAMATAIELAAADVLELVNDTCDADFERVIGRSLHADDDGEAAGAAGAAGAAPAVAGRTSRPAAVRAHVGPHAVYEALGAMVTAASNSVMLRAAPTVVADDVAAAAAAATDAADDHAAVRTSANSSGVADVSASSRSSRSASPPGKAAGSFDRLARRVNALIASPAFSYSRPPGGGASDAAPPPSLLFAMRCRLRRAALDKLVGGGEAVARDPLNAGATALHYAADRQQRYGGDVVRLLIAAAGNCNAATGGGSTPLHVALVTGHLAAVHALLTPPDDPPADPAVPMAGSLDTALHLAVRLRRPAPIVELLVAAGAPVAARNAAGKTALADADDAARAACAAGLARGAWARRRGGVASWQAAKQQREGAGAGSEYVVATLALPSPPGSHQRRRRDSGDSAATGRTTASIASYLFAAAPAPPATSPAWVLTALTFAPHAACRPRRPPRTPPRVPARPPPPPLSSPVAALRRSTAAAAAAVAQLAQRAGVAPAPPAGAATTTGTLAAAVRAADGPPLLRLLLLQSSGSSVFT